MAERQLQPEPARRAHFPLNTVLLMAVISVAVNGCSTVPEDPKAGDLAASQPTTLAPQSPQDEVLKQLGTLPGGKSIRLQDGGTALAEAPYFAASGRHCRLVRFGNAVAGSQKLACVFPSGWQWVPPIVP